MISESHEGQLSRKLNPLRVFTMPFFDSASRDILSEETWKATVDALFADRDVEVDQEGKALRDLSSMVIRFYHQPDTIGLTQVIDCQHGAGGERSHEVKRVGECEVHVITADFRSDADYFHDEVLKMAFEMGMDSVMDAYCAGVPIDHIVG